MFGITVSVVSRDPPLMGARWPVSRYQRYPLVSMASVVSRYHRYQWYHGITGFRHAHFSPSFARQRPGVPLREKTFGRRDQAPSVQDSGRGERELERRGAQVRVWPQPSPAPNIRVNGLRGYRRGRRPPVIEMRLG